jgi:hypothetical protein
MRQAQAEAKKEIDEYRALREAKLRSVQPEVRGRASAWRCERRRRRPAHPHRPRATERPRPQAQALDEKIRRVTQATSSQISQLE